MIKCTLVTNGELIIYRKNVQRNDGFKKIQSNKVYIDYKKNKKQRIQMPRLRSSPVWSEATVNVTIFSMVWKNPIKQKVKSL